VVCELIAIAFIRYRFMGGKLANTIVRPSRAHTEEKVSMNIGIAALAASGVFSGGTLAALSDMSKGGDGPLRPAGQVRSWWRALRQRVKWSAIKMRARFATSLAPMSAKDHKRKWCQARVMSVLPLKADIRQREIVSSFGVRAS